MNATTSSAANPSKALGGIEGFDVITHGGLPRGRTSLLDEMNGQLERGTLHSNQGRELVLSDAGVTLADIHTADGEVLMGSMQWEKQSAEAFGLETVAA